MTRRNSNENDICLTLFAEADNQGLTGKNLASAIGRSENTLTNWRQGHVQMKLIDAVLMADVLGKEIRLAMRPDTYRRSKRP